jgi:hypothetical protein
LEDAQLHRLPLVGSGGVLAEPTKRVLKLGRRGGDHRSRGTPADASVPSVLGGGTVR